MANNQSVATNLVEVVYQEDMTKKGLADLRKQYPKSFSLDMNDDEEFKQGRKIRTERNKLVKAINDRRIGFTNELKAYGDELIAKVDVIYDPIINAFELEDKRRKDEAARIAKEREEFLNKQREEITLMNGFVEQCKNQSSKFIAETIEAVDLVDTEAFDKDLIHEAIDTKKNILEALNNMYQAAKAAEAVAAEREQLRIQQEAVAQQERLQKKAQEIETRINDLRNDPMKYFDKTSQEIAQRIQKLESYAPTAEHFANRVDEVISVQVQVIHQLKTLLQQKQQLEAAQVIQLQADVTQAAEQDAATEAAEQATAEQNPTLEQQEREALTEATQYQEQSEPLLGDAFKSATFESTSSPAGYTPLDVWPSSQDRAEHDELDRICDQLDVAESYIEVLEQRLNKAHAA